MQFGVGAATDFSGKFAFLSILGWILSFMRVYQLVFFV